MPWTLSGIIIGTHNERQVLTNLLFCRENNLGDQIQLIKGRLEDLDNIPKVDAIISEWMGYLLLFEGMLDSVIYARDHHLKPGGLLLPNRCDMSLVGISDMGE
jgi:type I protein arginine methyltransferase